MCSGSPSTAGSHVASLDPGPGEQADQQSWGGGRNTEHLALQITASRGTASRECTVELMRGCRNAPYYHPISPPAMSAPLQSL